MHNKQINFILKFGTLLSIFSFIIIIWILLAKVDIVAQAVGQISPDGKVKTINVLTTSLVKKIYVKEGQYVEKDTVVAQLDVANYTSDEKSLAQQLSLDELSLKRIEAELTGKTILPKDSQHPTEIYDQVQSELLSKQASRESPRPSGRGDSPAISLNKVTDFINAPLPPLPCNMKISGR